MAANSNSKDKIRINFLIPRDRKEEIDRLANIESRSLSSLLNHLIVQHIEESKHLQIQTTGTSNIESLIADSARSGDEGLSKAKLTIDLLKLIYPNVKFHFSPDIQSLLDSHRG